MRYESGNPISRAHSLGVNRRDFCPCLGRLESLIHLYSIEQTECERHLSDQPAKSESISLGSVFCWRIFEISPQVIIRVYFWIDSCLGPIVYGSSEG